MKVYGFRPTEKQLEEAINYMKSSTDFKAKQIEGVLITYDVPEFIKTGTQCHPQVLANRVADRLIQKLRKEGKIERNSSSAWVWVGKKEDTKPEEVPVVDESSARKYTYECAKCDFSSKRKFAASSYTSKELDCPKCDGDLINTKW